MPDFSLRGFGGRNEEGGANAADSGGTPVTSGGAINTKGAYVQLIASTSFDAYALTIVIAPVGSTGSYLIDIAVGAAASEQDVISNILITCRDNSSANITVPLFIPASSRISARHQATGANAVIDLTVRIHGKILGNDSPLGRCTSYGPATGDSGGVSVDPGGVANTKGAYSQIVASTDNPARVLFVAFGNQNNFANPDSQQLTDIAVGAAASEQIIFADLPTVANAQGDVYRPYFMGPFSVNIPAGTRIAARAQSSEIDATDRLLDLAVYGMD